MTGILIVVGLVIIASYLIGSIPTGYLIVKGMTGQDIRTIGSGSTGATNVKRVLGKKWFFIVMLLDAFKGALPVILAKLYAGDVSNVGLFPVLAAVAVILAAVAVIIGHSKPIFLQFKGGKSVASGVGTILALNWQVGLIIAIVWSVVTYFSKYVSLGSIVALILSPFIMKYVGHAPIAYVGYCALGAIYIVYLHRQNIVRLIKGEENKVR